MAESNLKDLFLHTLKDIYFAEHEILKVLPEMAQAAHSNELKQALSKHRSQTEGQIQRLDEVFALVGEQPAGQPCKGIQGIIAEGKEILGEFADGPALDAGLIAAAQAVEHYEIARYGALCSWAELAALDDAADLLAQNLAEERETDLLLTQLAEEKANLESV